MSYTALAKRILLCDVISFDVFDTLLLRPFDDPQNRLLSGGGEGHCPFPLTRYRVLAEKQARQEALEKTGYNEVTLEDIYEKMQRYVAVDVEKAPPLWKRKSSFPCFRPTPMEKQLYDIAVELGKTVIAVTDMYLPPAGFAGGPLAKKRLHPAFPNLPLSGLRLFQAQRPACSPM